MSLLLVVCDQGQLMDEAVEPSCISLLDMDLHDVFVLEASFWKDRNEVVIYLT